MGAALCKCLNDEKELDVEVRHNINLISDALKRKAEKKKINSHKRIIKSLLT